MCRMREWKVDQRGREIDIQEKHRWHRGDPQVNEIEIISWLSALGFWVFLVSYTFYKNMVNYLSRDVSSDGAETCAWYASVVPNTIMEAYYWISLLDMVSNVGIKKSIERDLIEG